MTPPEGSGTYRWLCRSPNPLLLFSVWFIGTMIICAVIVPMVLWFGTPFVREHELFVKRF